MCYRGEHLPAAWLLLEPQIAPLHLYIPPPRTQIDVRVKDGQQIQVKLSQAGSADQTGIKMLLWQAVL